MTRVPFVTDNVKKEYLVNIATNRVCENCEYACSSECGLTQESVKRTVVDEVQDLFDIAFSCSRNPDKVLKISKFFLPNTNFEKDYLEDISKLSESKININGRKVLDELLKWGRLEITKA